MSFVSVIITNLRCVAKLYVSWYTEWKNEKKQWFNQPISKTEQGIIHLNQFMNTDSFVVIGTCSGKPLF